LLLGFIIQLNETYGCGIKLYMYAIT
jgi:hypothetical protein